VIPESILRKLRDMSAEEASQLAQRMNVQPWLIETWACGAYISDRMLHRLERALEDRHAA